MKIANILNKRVKNLKGTSDKDCNCESWFEHWEKSSGSKAKQCSVISCSHEAEVGAHVIRCDSSDESHYIVPMCHGHNQIEDECLTVNKQLVSANVQETCGL